MSMRSKKEYKWQHFNRLITLGNSIKTDEYLVKDILHDHLINIPNMMLYKYRKCEEFNFDSLLNNNIWMSKPDDFNDLFDCTINIDLKRNNDKVQKWFKENIVAIVTNIINSANGRNKLPYNVDINFVREIINQFFTPSGHLLKKNFDEYLNTNFSIDEIEQYIRFISDVEKIFSPDNKEIVDNFINVINEQRNHARSKTLVYSMTEDFNNGSMWEHYADQYKGFCIEYSFHNFDQHKFDHYKHLIYLLPISYYKRIPYFDIVPLLETTLLHNSSNNWNSEQTIQLNLQLLSKSKDYEYEKEWRFSIKNNNCNLQSFPFVSKLLAGRNISDINYKKLKKAADSLSVPIVRQTIDTAIQRYVYV